MAPGLLEVLKQDFWEARITPGLPISNFPKEEYFKCTNSLLLAWKRHFDAKRGKQSKLKQPWGQRCGKAGIATTYRASHMGASSLYSDRSTSKPAACQSTWAGCARWPEYLDSCHPPRRPRQFPPPGFGLAVCYLFQLTWESEPSGFQINILKNKKDPSCNLVTLATLKFYYTL